MKEVFGYTRVSTARQGEKGVSLVEQKKAIQHYADNHSFTIINWFEERETAAKQGRAVFRKMIEALRKGNAAGVIAHKIDRSARNLRDWADLVDLADGGLEVHFANESIDMQMRGGRLSADIQAVVAADYVRNLREETIKGIRGRLEQGLYPFRAPIGYLDCGGGNPKEIDPVKGPILHDLFKKYATADFPLNQLLLFAEKSGLRNHKGNPITMNGLCTILHNPFYTGLIHIKRTGESFNGIHDPLIDTGLFQTVQDVLSGKRVRGMRKVNHTYRRMLTCTACSRSLIGEQHGEKIYYRCHQCKQVSFREEAVDEVFKNILGEFKLSFQETADIKFVAQYLDGYVGSKIDTEKRDQELQLKALKDRLKKLTDVLLDGLLSKEEFLEKKNQLVNQINSVSRSLESEISILERKRAMLRKNLEFFGNAYFAYQIAEPEEKRRLVLEITLNRFVQGKELVISPLSPFRELCELKNSDCGDPHRGGPRKSRTKLEQKTFREKLIEYVDRVMEGEGAQVLLDKVPEVPKSPIFLLP